MASASPRALCPTWSGHLPCAARQFGAPLYALAMRLHMPLRKPGQMTCTSFLDAGYAAIREQIAGARAVVLFLDFDGTLATLRQFPDDAQLEPPVRATLDALVAQPGVLISIVSGREMWDLRRRVGIPGIVYAGEHGMEIRGRGLDRKSTRLNSS